MSATSTPEQPPPPPPTFLDYAFQAAQNAADTIIAGIPEVRSVAVFFDWGVPVTSDVPPGVAFTRGPGGEIADVRHPLPLFGLLQQHGRLGLSLATRFQQLLVAANDTAANIAKLINERQRHLDELNARIAAAEREPGAGPAGG